MKNVKMESLKQKFNDKSLRDWDGIEMCVGCFESL